MVILKPLCKLSEDFTAVTVRYDSIGIWVVDIVSERLKHLYLEQKLKGVI